jgi:hypothetical protein
MRLLISPTLLSVLRIDPPPGDDGRSAAFTEGDRLPSSTLFAGLDDDISLNSDAGNCSFDFEASVFCGVDFMFCRACGRASPPGVVAGIDCR